MMRTLYFDCGMGAAGDMLTASLYELLNNEERKLFIEKMNTVGIPKIKYEAEASTKCGIVGTHMKVTVDGMEEMEHHHHHEGHDHHHEGHDHHHEEHDHHHEGHDHHHGEHDHHEENHHHHHSSMADIEAIFNTIDIPQKVKEGAVSVYKLIAEAESASHGVAVSEIHFHEVGSMDAIADVTAVCLLLDMLKPDKIIASPVHVGSGHVHCAHGILPVPAPATAYVLKDVPIYGGGVKGELCTPTGAALLKHFVNEFGEMPVMKVEKIGYGMGKKDFSAANCVRALIGNSADDTNVVVELTCNVDDMTPERIGFAMNSILEAGALEAYTIPVGMKKSRPGIMICVMCKESKKDEMIQTIFKHTTTIGIRENISKRYILSRKIDKVETQYGEVRVKRSEGYGIKREKYEYEDLAKIAKEKNMSIDEVLRGIENA